MSASVLHRIERAHAAATALYGADPRVDIVENPFPRIDHGNNRGELTAQKNFLTPLGGACGIQHGTWEDDTESTSVPKKLPESPGECLVQIYISRS